MIITPLTELEAVNEILASIGEAPVDTLEEPENVDVMNARRMLALVSKSVQARGWAWNTISEYVMKPDRFTHQIQFNDSLLRFIPNDFYGRKRNGVLYNLTDNTDTFTADVIGEATLLVPFDEVPEPFRHYITIRAARMFSVRYQGDSETIQELMQEEQQAYQYMFEFDIDVTQPNMANNNEVRELMRRN